MTERRSFRAAAVQMTSTTDVDANLSEAARLIDAAVAGGAELIVLPENFSFLGSDDAARVAVAEEAGRGPAQQFAIDAAKRYGIWLVAGTIPIKHDSGRVRSRSLLVAPDGSIADQYDKIHLFDVSLPASDGESYRESATTVAGDRVVSAATSLGRIGLTVCYDIRFPALFDRLGIAGTDVIAVPAAFTVPTGRLHWLPLLKARAIESLAYVIAAGQWGEHAGGRKTYGHSMIVGPWGDVVAECATGAGIVAAELDMIGLDRLRRQFPALEHRRTLD